MKIEASIQVFGDQFRPSLIDDSIKSYFYRYKDNGSLGESGRYKNLPLPYGRASIEAPEGMRNGNIITWLLEFISQNVQTLKDHGADEFYFYISFHYKGELDWEFSKHELELMSNAGITLRISVYEINGSSCK